MGVTCSRGSAPDAAGTGGSGNAVSLHTQQELDQAYPPPPSRRAPICPWSRETHRSLSAWSALLTTPARHLSRARPSLPGHRLATGTEAPPPRRRLQHKDARVGRGSGEDPGPGRWVGDGPRVCTEAGTSALRPRSRVLR